MRWGLVAHAHRTRDDVDEASDEEPGDQVVQRAGLQGADGVFSDDEEADQQAASSGLPATYSTQAVPGGQEGRHLEGCRK